MRVDLAQRGDIADTSIVLNRCGFSSPSHASLAQPPDIDDESIVYRLCGPADDVIVKTRYSRLNSYKSLRTVSINSHEIVLCVT